MLLPVSVRSSLRPSPKSIVTFGTGRTLFQCRTKFSRSALEISSLAYSVVRKNRLLAQVKSSFRLPSIRRLRIGLPLARAASMALSKSVYQYSRDRDAVALHADLVDDLVQPGEAALQGLELLNLLLGRSGFAGPPWPGRCSLPRGAGTARRAPAVPRPQLFDRRRILGFVRQRLAAPGSAGDCRRPGRHLPSRRPEQPTIATPDKIFRMACSPYETLMLSSSILGRF